MSKPKTYDSPIFPYRVKSHLYYDLIIEYTFWKQRRQIVGARIYQQDGKYLGYWDVFNMPLMLAAKLQRFVEKTCREKGETVDIETDWLSRG